jgi:hypothetical protein
MNYLFIILPAIAIASVVILYVLTRNAQEIKEEAPVIKFQPRKVVDLSTPSSVSTEKAIAPKKKKYYKKRPKKTE